MLSAVMPPSPILAETWYGPSVVPALRAMVPWDLAKYTGLRQVVRGLGPGLQRAATGDGVSVVSSSAVTVGWLGSNCDHT